jgi:cytochrome c biogenesis protein CcmG/thiol:disulfide interchange protein DsbE
MRINRAVAGPALFFVLLLGGRPPLQQAFAQEQSNAGKQEPLIPEGQRKPAPKFILTDAKGDIINLSTYKEKVVLLDFWATWCGGCKTEIPWYMEFDAKYRDRGLAVIGVSMDEDGWKTVRPFLALDKDPETGGHTAMKYPVVIGSDSLAKQYKLTSMPMTLLIDRDGRIAVSHTGMVDKDDWESKIRALLK